MKITIIGAGAWGSALALSLVQDHALTLCARTEDEADQIRRPDGHESPFLPGFILPPAIRIVGNKPDALAAPPDLIIIATPMAGLRPTLEFLCDQASHFPFIWVCKGLEQGSGLLAHQVVHAVFGRNKPPLHGVLSGPSFAEEVARGQPAALALAGSDPVFANEMACRLNSPRLRIYAGDDLIGVELGGAVKNILAIAAGICDGLGLGLNARAALITRGLAEMSRLGIALGARRETFMGLSGIGDLLLTATGDLSRNRRVGLALAENKTLPAILEELGHVAEGVSTTREVSALARRLGIEMPITEAVDSILYQGITAESAVKQLLARDAKNEFQPHHVSPELHNKSI